MVTSVVHLAVGAWTLAGMLVRTRGRLGSAYWSWRRSTAMGSGERPSGRFGAGVGYVRWIGAMRMLGR